MKTSQVSVLRELNLANLIKDFLVILPEKEYAVITKRFSLNNRPKETLEKIGQQFSVTRERVRQMESSALKKLRRNISNTKLNLISEAAEQILRDCDGLCSVTDLTSKILSQIHHTSPIDGQIINLSLIVNDKFQKVEFLKNFNPFWILNALVSRDELDKISTVLYKNLKIAGDLIDEKSLINAVLKTAKVKISPMRILQVLKIDSRFKGVEKKWGLREWRHINPRSIRDRAMIVMRNAGKPLHFVEIANRIASSNFAKKNVTQQAVHNDLIRHRDFVLVGRGIYALSEWGFTYGTVSDVIADVLRKFGPLSKQKIISEVLKQRDVKIGTISLNLQKNPAFARVGRAVYSFDEKKWEEPRSKRGRAARGSKKD